MTKLQRQADLISKIPELEQDPETSEEALAQARAAEAELIAQIQKHPHITVVYESFQAFEAAYQALHLRQLQQYLHPDKYEYLKSLGYHPVFQEDNEDEPIGLANNRTSVKLKLVNRSAVKILGKEVAVIEKQYAALKVLNTLARAHRSEAVPEGYQIIAETSDQDLRQDPYTQWMQRHLQVESCLMHTIFPYSSFYAQYSFYEDASKTWNGVFIGNEDGSISRVPSESIQAVLLERVDQWEPTLGAETCTQLKASMIKILANHSNESMFNKMKALLYEVSSDFEPISFSFFKMLGEEMKASGVRLSFSVNPAQFFSAVSLAGRATAGLITQTGESLRNALR